MSQKAFEGHKFFLLIVFDSAHVPAKLYLSTFKGGEVNI